MMPVTIPYIVKEGRRWVDYQALMDAIASRVPEGKAVSLEALAEWLELAQFEAPAGGAR